MKCVICRHGETQPGTATLTLERGTFTFVVKNVPARVCDNCGEEYFDQEVAAHLFDVAEEVARGGAEIDVRQYVAA